MPHVHVVVRTSPELAYDLVSDVTSMGRWSPETQEAHWIGPATAAAPGARFVGRNRRRRAWSTTCTVTEADRGRRFAFKVGGGETTWAYDFTTVAGGCRVTESFEVVRPPGPIGRWLTKQGVGLPWAERERDLVEGMRVTLDRLKAAAEAAVRGASTSVTDSPLTSPRPTSWRSSSSRPPWPPGCPTSSTPGWRPRPEATVPPSTSVGPDT